MPGLRPPEFNVVPNASFAVALRNAPVYSAETERWLRRYASHDLSPNQVLPLAYAREHDGTFTSSAYQRLVGTDIYSASRDIKDLIRKGLSNRQKKGGRTYELVEPDSPPELPSDFDRVRQRLDKHGFLTNQDVRALLDID